MTKIVVDADACPVKQEIIETARQYGVEVLMVASYDHHIESVAGVQVVQVDRSAQSADIYISNHIQANQILITQDYGLAAIALAKQAVVINNRGRLYSNKQIDIMLEQRHEHAKMRKQGKYGKGPKRFSAQDRNIFLQTLTKVLDSLQEIGGK